MMIWLEDAPVFGVDNDEHIVTFIDWIITCEKPNNNSDLLQLVNQQTHNHSHTCRKKSKNVCRFNFPQPPMKKTQILYPLDDTVSPTIVKNLKESWRGINKKLNDLKEGKDVTFEKRLDSLSVSEET